MKLKYKILLALVILPWGLTSIAQQPWSVRMANSVMERHPGGIRWWDYVTGTYLEGVEEVWKITGDSSYYDFIRQSIDAVVNQDGLVSGYDLTDYNIDDTKQGAQLLFMYKSTGNVKYKTAAENVRKQFYTHPRTNEGGFWHKQIYPWQMWLDGLYMGSPFYFEYGRLFHEEESLEDVLHQLILMENHGRDTVTGLLYHGYDESRNQAWSDPVTGQSPSFWGRGMGWYAMALVDIYEILPANFEGRDSIAGILQRFAEAIKDYQDPTRKVWWQVVDRGGELNNYTESSASCMFVYALAKGLRLGILDEEYRQVTIDGFNGIINEFIEVNGDGTIDLTQTCRSAGLGGNPYRNGSYDYYTLSAGYVTNDGKGEGPFMMAASEIEMLDKLYPIALLQADSTDETGVFLSWSEVPLDADSLLLERFTGNNRDGKWTFSASTREFKDNSFFQPGEKYIYRIRSFNENDTSLVSLPAIYSALNPGNLPIKASDPYPSDMAENVSQDLSLQWTAGNGATLHKVYFGTDNPPPFKEEKTSAVFSLSELGSETTYYWRIDEINENGTTEGDTWSFTTRIGDTLVGHWTFDELEGNVVKDSSGFGNDGLLINAVSDNHAPGYRNGSLYLSGNEYVRIPHSGILNFGNEDFTIAFYTRADIDLLNESDEYRWIIKGSHVKNESEALSGKRYELFLNVASDEFRFAIDDDLVKSRTELTASSLLNGEWVHIAAVRKALTHQVLLYVNGDLKSVSSGTTGDIDQMEDLLIGANVEDENRLIGYMDDLRIYNYALISTQIKKFLDPIPGTSFKNVNVESGNVNFNYSRDFQSGELLVSLPGESEVSCELYSISGSICHSEVLELDIQGNGKNSIALTMDPGVYLLAVKGKNSLHTMKIVVQ